MILWSVLGAALLALVLYDLVSTSFAIGSHGGPMTRRLSKLIWRFSQGAVHRKRGRGTSVGTRLLITVVIAWMLLSWLAWFFVFLGFAPSVVSAETGDPAGIWARLYFAGFTLFTLGVGDYRPSGALWQVLTALAAGQGFFVLTLAVTYMVPVVSAVTQKRKVARTIWLLGSGPVDMVRTAWTGHDFGTLSNRLTTVASDLLMVQQQHFAYPVLHYFVAVEPEASLGRAVAALDQAVLLWESGVAPEVRPEGGALESVRKAVHAYLGTRQFAQVESPEAFDHKDPPTLPPLRAVAEAGVPVVDDAAYRAAAREHDDHRRLLDALIQHEGWTWDDVLG